MGDSDFVTENVLERRLRRERDRTDAAVAQLRADLLESERELGARLDSVTDALAGVNDRLVALGTSVNDSIAGLTSHLLQFVGVVREARQAWPTSAIVFVGACAAIVAAIIPLYFTLRRG